MNKKEKKIEPTPDLGKPKSNRQMFTHAENKLLDQITLEIVEAWEKDLRMMKSAYNKTREYIENLNTLQIKLGNIRSYLDEYDLPKLKEFIERQDYIVFYVNELRVMVSDINNKLDRFHRDRELKTKPEKKKHWWEFWK